MKNINCKTCKEEFSPKKSINMYCSSKCYGVDKSKKLKGKKPLYMAGFKKGVVPANKGKHTLNSECPNCKIKFYCKPSDCKIFCSKLCKDKVQQSQRSAKKVRNAIRRLKKYSVWKKEVLSRHTKCIRCGSASRLEIDHFPRTLDALVKSHDIKRQVDTLDIPEFWDVNNGRVLCNKCHHKSITSKNTIFNIKNRRVCVTGGAGMIGSHLVDELIKRGNYVLVIDNLSNGEKEFINEKADFVWFDVREDQAGLTKLFKKKKIEFVFHLVSLPFIPNCFADPIPFFDVNARGTMNVLMSSQEARVKKILVYSSAEIYGTKDRPIKETDVLNPQSTYGVAKIAADQLSKIRYVEADLPVVINRQFNVFSWRARHPYIIPEIISQLSESDTLHLGNIYAYRDFLFIEDAVNMAIELLEKGIVGEEYNVGATNCIQIKELVKVIAKIMGKKNVKIVVDKTRLRPWEITRLQADTTKLSNTISYKPQYDIEKGLRVVIDKFYSNGKKWDF
jgi:UDP-glucose 4-epimerase